MDSRTVNPELHFSSLLHQITNGYTSGYTHPPTPQTNNVFPSKPAASDGNATSSSTSSKPARTSTPSTSARSSFSKPSTAKGQLRTSSGRPIPDASNIPSGKGDQAILDGPRMKAERSERDVRVEQEMLQRRKSLMAKLKLREPKDPAAPNASANKEPAVTKPTTSSTTETKPAGTTANANKMSYQEMMQRARLAYAQAPKPGLLVHKARPASSPRKASDIKKHKAEYKKRAKAEKAEARRGSRSPEPSSGAAKKLSSIAAGKAKVAPKKSVIPQKSPIPAPSEKGAINKKASVSKIVAAPKKKGIMENGADSRRPSMSTKAKAPELGIKRKNTNDRRLDAKRTRGAGHVDEDDEFIVDDESPKGRATRYTYYESEYDSGSDMEATGADILEEEELSRKRALREDMEQEKLEKALAAKKAAMKKKFAKK